MAEISEVERLKQIREELKARGLDYTGLKATLVERLRKALADEKAQAEKEPTDIESSSTSGLVKLFVGQVPPQTTDEELRSLYSPYGDVKEVVVLKDRVSGAHRGCGFVSYATKEEAERAIEALNDKVKLSGAKREMIVRIAGARPDEEKKDSEYKVYVGMLSRKSTEEDVRKLFEPYGDVLEVYLMRQKDLSSQSKGAGFVKYPTRDEALRAIQALNGRHRDKDAPALLQVRFAQTKAEKAQTLSSQFSAGLPLAFQTPGPWLWNPSGVSSASSIYGASYGTSPGTTTQFGFGSQSSMPGGSDFGTQPINPYASYYSTPESTSVGYEQQSQQASSTEPRGPPGANLFIYNVPDSYDDQDLATLFSNFGHVLSTKIQRDKVTGASKGFGFVSFDNVKSANAAIASMDGFMIGSKRLNVRVKKAGGGSTSGSTTSFSPY